MSDNIASPSPVAPSPLVPQARPLVGSADWFENVADYRRAAMYWCGYGFDVIPVLPGNKLPAVKWDPWLSDLGPNQVNDYWTKNPSHEIGFIVNAEIIVFDADGPESVAAIKEIESRFCLTPKLVVKTKKGEHHYFRRSTDTVAKTDSHSSEKHPARLDVKTGRTMVVLPPSTGKYIIENRTESKNDLTTASQEFIDAVYIHNGRPAPSEVKVAPSPIARSVPVESDDVLLIQIESLLQKIDPDSGYDDWRSVLMAVYHETRGSDEGLALVDLWSSKGSKYSGTKDIETKWRSFRLDVPNPLTIGTLIKMARDTGANVADILGAAFEPCQYEVVSRVTHAVSAHLKTDNPLAKFFIQDVGELERNAVDEVSVLGNLALMGQATVIYAKQNTGKTLVTLHLIVEGIKSRKFDPSKLIYLNMDDDSRGLVVKARIAQEYGFQMVADGYNDFKAREFRTAMEAMITTDAAKGVILILDTLKKFVDTMHKAKSTEFTKAVRRFILKGGTVIALSHTNKNPGKDGKIQYSGTTDIIDDFDCGYILTTIVNDTNRKEKVVEFERIKGRGTVALAAAYSYSIEDSVSYDDLLLSVQEVDHERLTPLKQAAMELTDAEIITVLEGCIKEGINLKMKLVSAASERAAVSQRAALKVLEKYTGNDPIIHRWGFAVRERGAKVYELLKHPIAHPPALPMATP
ncbi:PriCT-2 domain-containing protein [Geomonas propionica]|uniref:PriCT-2 domain-containing protein n=1 Tax=Geomonas propionica TaxID=2798582 RepID=A0ABS0YVR4_9BACT|nr:PriCT-2 domain-containing protein [Geomonas propionica]MBJ6802065.1 PriCT-2 domain-containing protein [Geomonas propionica]